MNRSEQLEAYRRMQRIRQFEVAGIKLYKAGKIPGVYHASIGQEAAIVGACMALRDEDYMVGTHRSHGHPIGKGAKLDALMAELLGKATGICKGRGGSIVNISSMTALAAFPESAVYGASKAAVRLLTKSTARDCAPEGIRANCVLPGPIDTEMFRPLVASEGMRELEKGLPLGRIGRPEDVAHAVLYLASDEASLCDRQRARHRRRNHCDPVAPSCKRSSLRVWAACRRQTPRDRAA